MHLLLECTIPVRRADLDVNGHVNNAVFFTYFEEARIIWMTQMKPLIRAEGQGLVVAKTGCTYKKPIPYPETLTVRMYGGGAGRSSFRTQFDLRGASLIQYAEAEAVMVWVDRTKGNSCPLPHAIRERLTG